jgi:hypothetical protein
MGSAYGNYRQDVMEQVAHSQDLIGELAVGNTDLAKLAHAPVEQIFTPLSVAYIKDAFLDATLGQTKNAQAKATVEKVTPSENTLSMSRARRIQNG